MSGKAEKLAHMANQIAAFFRAYPDAQAVAGTREHIQAFWTPGMRRDLLALCEAGEARLDPIVVAALHGTAVSGSPIRKETAGPDALGRMESDAG